METRRVALRVFLDSIGLLSILHIGTPTMQDRLNGKQRDLFRFIYPPPFSREDILVITPLDCEKERKIEKTGINKLASYIAWNVSP